MSDVKDGGLGITRPTLGESAPGRHAPPQSAVRAPRLQWRTYSSASTTTDLAGSVIVSLPPSSFAPSKDFGATTVGAAKVLWLSIAGAVRTRPETFFAVEPASVVVTVIVSRGFKLVSERW